MLDICKIKPGEVTDTPLIDNSGQTSQDREHLEQIENDMKGKNKAYDSGLSIGQERYALIYSLMQEILQIRGLLYYRLLKIMVIVGHNDIECCYLMPSKPEETKGVLADQYYQSLLRMHSHKLPRRREKFIRYLEEGWSIYTSKAQKLIRLGVMDRLFKRFDFFSTYDRDSMNPPKGAKKLIAGSSKLPIRQNQIFGEVEYIF